ncbi:hypothetical protein FHS82_002002 [Pseudochelatococcus lubricantis]|uniref:Uncharacterized protein n=1 Tax=Pseudochelatococcus lubricantis TaxID=1538102 RepID=A0ABX0V1H9_9HYPH|nr:hypothetical protein [Pseudochelatococcus lubricantis]NIJ58160.1 hypothetical protein [Pseudochelatococcus lubricantis]
MSTLRDAMAAIRSIILIEERVRQQGEKVEKLANHVVDIDRRLLRVETVIDLALDRRGGGRPRIGYGPADDDPRA